MYKKVNRLKKLFYMNNLTNFSRKREALEMKIDVLVFAASICLTVYFQFNLHWFCLNKQTKNKTFNRVLDFFKLHNLVS